MPYPYALDHDQAANAATLAAAGGAKVIAQADLSAEKLSAIITKAMDDPAALAAMATNARKAGRPHAARLLADMVEAIAGGMSIAEFKGRRT